MKIPTKSWEEIYSFYKDLNENHHCKFESIIDLVLMIRNSKYRNGVYGYTSHEILYIGQYPTLEENNALLKVEYKPNKGEITFSYKGDNTLKYSWQKSFSENKASSEFERFIQELKWVM